MSNQRAGIKLGRNSKHRKALFRNQLISLIKVGSVVTTEAKAKHLKSSADHVFAQAKDDSLANRRLLHKSLGRRDAVNTLVDRIAPQFKNRKSGFVRIKPVGKRRGDNALLYRVELMDEVTDIGGLKLPVEKQAKAKAKPKVPAKETTETKKKSVSVAKPKRKEKVGKTASAKTKAGKK